MRALGLCGSARTHGNTHVLLREVLLGARESGMEVEEIFLNELHIKPCTGCRACREFSEECVQVDDFDSVIQRVKEADLVVIGSPVYMGQVSGQTKLFLDRLYSLRRADRTIRIDGTQKRGVSIAVCGRTDPEHLRPTLRSLNMLFRFLNTPPATELAGLGLSRPGDAARDLEALARARSVGRQLAVELLQTAAE